MSNFKYYNLKIKLKSEQLGSCPDKASIWDAHILQKIKKQLKELNKTKKKISKADDKVIGAENSLTPDKEKKEILGIIYAVEEQLGSKTSGLEELSYEELMAHAKTVEQEWSELLSNGEAKSATVFMRNKEGRPVISTHMLLGNLKEISRNMANNSKMKNENEEEAKKKQYFKSKVSIGELFAQDVKAVEDFVPASNDIVRKENGERDLLERPLLKEVMGKKESCIAISERLPEGTEYEMTLRVRADSPVLCMDGDHEVLWHLLDHGKSCGLGPWRGSGQKGAYYFQLTNLPDYVEKKPEGWN